MHIALDARMMGAGNTRGIGRYIEETVRAVLEVDDEVRYTLVVRDLVGTPFAGHPRVDHVVADIPWYSFREQWKMGSILEGIGADLIHIPHWNVSLRLRKPFVATIHDVLLLRQAASAKNSTKHFFIRWMKYSGFRFVIDRAMNRACHLFTPTKFVADEMRALTQVPAAKTSVTGEGVTLFSRIDSGLCSSSPYLLYVGSAYPHKRLDLLVSAWEKVSSTYPTHELLIAGERDVFMKRIEDQVADFENKKCGDRVKFLGRVTDAQLAGLYQGASLFVFPSSYEGFGLPPLEALSLGCPVIASDIPCLREVLPQDGVAWFRDGDEHDIIRVLEQSLGDLSSQKQGALRGQDSVLTQYAWRQSAKRLVEGYRQTIERG
jgi:glycosyltransferase involved in cell wall biosynthesis